VFHEIAGHGSCQVPLTMQCRPLLTHPLCCCTLREQGIPGSSNVFSRRTTKRQANALARYWFKLGGTV
jgi:hypothetical protein